MKTLTFGQMPTEQQFHRAFGKQCNVHAMFSIILSDEDYRMFESVGLPFIRSCDEESLYGLVEHLAAIADGQNTHGEPWSDGEMEWAGSFASAIMYSLGFDWV